MNPQRQTKVIEMPGSKPDRTIREHKATSTFCFMMDDGGLRAFLRVAQIARKSGEPFSIEAAAVSLILDEDKGEIKGDADYYRLWGWSRQEYRSRIEQVRTRAANWRSAYGRVIDRGRLNAINNQPITNEQPTDNHEHVDSGSQSQGDNQLITNEQPTDNQHTIPAITLGEESRGGNVRVREDSTTVTEELKFNPAYAWPSLEEVLEFAATESIPTDMAKDIFYSYSKDGWEGVRHWGYAVINAYRYRKDNPKKGSGHGQRKQQSSTEPRTLAESRESVQQRVERIRREREGGGA